MFSLGSCPSHDGRPNISESGLSARACVSSACIYISVAVFLIASRQSKLLQSSCACYPLWPNLRWLGEAVAGSIIHRAQFLWFLLLVAGLQIKASRVTEMCDLVEHSVSVWLSRIFSSANSDTAAARARCWPPLSLKPDPCLKIICAADRLLRRITHSRPEILSFSGNTTQTTTPDQPNVSSGSAKDITHVTNVMIVNLLCLIIALRLWSVFVN